MKKTASAIGKDNVDVYHGTNFRLRARGRFGSIITIHDLALKIFPHLRRRWLGDWLGHIKTSRDARLSDRVIADSDATARDIERHIDISRGKLRVIHLAAGAEFRPVEDRQMIASLLARIGMKKPRYILFSGTLEPRKNVPVLLQAYLGLLSEHPDTGLVLAGMPGWKSAKITDFIRMNGLAEDVRITGYLTLQDLAALYSGASVFVLPSLYEGFGLPPLEAMACGSPVIVSNGGSLPEVVGDAAIVLPPDDAEGFRREIARVLSSPELAQEMRGKGFRRAALFSWGRTAAETLKVYREVAG
jgi:glycosyltransferase involved in cell wall biosynthesis